MPDSGSLVYSRRDRTLVALSAMFGYGLDLYNLIIVAFLFSAMQSSLGMTVKDLLRTADGERRHQSSTPFYLR